MVMEDPGAGMSAGCGGLSLAERLSAALELQQAGRAGEAAVGYEAILADDRANVAALYYLGLLRHGQGDLARAAELVGRAAELRPEDAAIRAKLAEVLLDLGQYKRAAESAGAAVRLGQDDPRTRCTLGLALHALGRSEVAIGEFRHAVSMRPDFAETHNLLGSVLMALGRLDEARCVLLTAVQFEPGMAIAHARLGEIDFKQDRINEAGHRLVKATQLDPDCALYWELLAEVHEYVEQPAAAILCWERVLALTPDARAHPHLALGWMLQEEGRLDEAEAHYRTAAALEPGSALAVYNMGGLLEERGEFAAAESAFRAAIRHQPTFALPHARLATLLRGALPAPDLDALMSLLDDPKTEGGSRARLLFALGHVLDARGDHPRAAAALRQANAAHLASIRTFRRFDPVAYDRFVDEVIRAFDADFFARAAGAGLETRKPVFVIGLPRSGTTLLEQILASHPLVHGAGELLLGQRIFEYLPAALGCTAAATDCLARLDPPKIRQLAVRYIDRLVAKAGGHGERIVDKMPENVLYLGLLSVLFPCATVIHCRRDLRDVALSCWLTDFRSLSWTNDAGHIGAKFRATLRLMEHWRAVLPSPIHEVDYEDVVTDIEAVARRLLAALGLEWDPACLDFHRTRRPIRTTSVAQVRRPLHARSVGRWTLYESLLPELFAALPTGSGRAA
jgi:tetratricopeptide (TPR) repeat protein